MIHLAGNALHERAGEQVVRQHHHLLHAQHHLPLHSALQARPGDAGEGQVHQFVVRLLHQPAGHLGDIAIGLAVRRAAPQQHHTGGGGVGHVQLAHALAQVAAQHIQDGVACGEVRAIQKFGAGAVFAGMLNGLGNLHLHVACRVQDERQHQHAAGVACGVQQAVVQAGGRKLDEAHLDIPAGLACAPLGHKAVDFVVALGLARAVADEQNGVFVACAVVCTEGRGWGLHQEVSVGAAGTLALRKR